MCASRELELTSSSGLLIRGASEFAFWISGCCWIFAALARADRDIRGRMLYITLEEYQPSATALQSVEV
jgi:hypothetical protein